MAAACFALKILFQIDQCRVIVIPVRLQTFLVSAGRESKKPDIHRYPVDGCLSNVRLLYCNFAPAFLKSGHMVCCAREWETRTMPETAVFFRSIRTAVPFRERDVRLPPRSRKAPPVHPSVSHEFLLRPQASGCLIPQRQSACFPRQAASAPLFRAAPPPKDGGNQKYSTVPFPPALRTLQAEAERTAFPLRQGQFRTAGVRNCLPH